jgi:hypothetical protein
MTSSSEVELALASAPASAAKPGDATVTLPKTAAMAQDSLVFISGRSF